MSSCAENRTDSTLEAVGSLGHWPLLGDRSDHDPRGKILGLQWSVHGDYLAAHTWVSRSLCVPCCYQCLAWMDFHGLPLPLHSLGPWFVSFPIPELTCGHPSHLIPLSLTWELGLPCHTLLALFLLELPIIFSSISILFLAASISSAPQQNKLSFQEVPQLWPVPLFLILTLLADHSPSCHTKLIGTMCSPPTRLLCDILSFSLYLTSYSLFMVQFNPCFFGSWRPGGKLLQGPFPHYSCGILGIPVLSYLSSGTLSVSLSWFSPDF